VIVVVAAQPNINLILNAYGTYLFFVDAFIHSYNIGVKGIEQLEEGK